MPQSQAGSLARLLREGLLPNNVSAEAEELAAPGVETGQSSFHPSARSGQSERSTRPTRLVYNEERLRFLTNLAHEMTQLANDSGAWQDYVDELQEWAAATADGLAEDDST